ncbi:MAG: FixH family protein [Burkholderiales bacterium]
MRTLQTQTRSWYREPWPWLLIALPASAVVAGLITLLIAIKHEDALVADDYYKQGLAINQDLARESRATELNLRANVMFGDRIVRVIIVHSDTMPAALTLRFVHPTRSGEDRVVTVQSRSGGWYEGNLPELAHGSWRLQLEDAERSWRLSGNWRTDDDSLALISAGAREHQ